MSVQTVPYQSRNYTVGLDSNQSWAKALSSIAIKNSKKQFVYRKHTDGNRVAILVNMLHQQGLTKYVEHNGTWYIYIPSMDVLVSRATKKIAWEDKANPQRIKIIADCAYDSHAGANHPAHAKQ